MGRVRTEVLVENMKDLWSAESGHRPPEQVRRINVKDALVDTGATTLALPTRLIQQLGLNKVTEKRVTSSKGSHLVNIYDAVRVTILDRFCTVDVMEVPDDVPVRVGQIPLEMLDLVVDPQGGRLIGNPAHGGEHVLELYLFQREAALS
jgi:predicted aspartyl protease